HAILDFPLAVALLESIDVAARAHAQLPLALAAALHDRARQVVELAQSHRAVNLDQMVANHMRRQEATGSRLRDRRGDLAALQNQPAKFAAGIGMEGGGDAVALHPIHTATIVYEDLVDFLLLEKLPHFIRHCSGHRGALLLPMKRL